MAQDTHHLARLLRSFFNSGELRQFLISLDDGDNLLVHLPSNSASLVEACEEAASLLDRWGMSDAELFGKLHQQRPTRLAELIAYRRLRVATPTTLTRRTISIEMTASIEGSPVGVYRLCPGQVKLIGRSGDAEIQFPVELAKLSRLHAWASWPSCGPMIQDLESKNGTWLNGRRTSRGPLRQGDLVQLGEIKLLIQEPDRTETVGPREEDTLS